MLNTFWAALTIWSALPYLLIAGALLLMLDDLWWSAGIAIVSSGLWFLPRGITSRLTINGTCRPE